MVDFLEVLVFRDRGISVAHVLPYVVDVIIDILGGVGEAAGDTILVIRWGI